DRSGGGVPRHARPEAPARGRRTVRPDGSARRRAEPEPHARRVTLGVTSARHLFTALSMSPLRRPSTMSDFSSSSLSPPVYSPDVGTSLPSPSRPRLLG